MVTLTHHSTEDTSGLQTHSSRLMEEVLKYLPWQSLSLLSKKNTSVTEVHGGGGFFPAVVLQNSYNVPTYINHDPVSTPFALLLVSKSEVGLCIVILITLDRTSVINAHLTSINEWKQMRKIKNHKKNHTHTKITLSDETGGSTSFMVYLLVSH